MTQTLTPSQVQILQQADAAAEAERRAGMSREERQAHLALQGLERTQDVPDDMDLQDFTQDDDVLHGRTPMDISHAGEAIPEDEADEDDADLLQQLREHHNQLFAGRSRRRRDRRARRNRTQIMVDVFAAQLEKMTDAYVDWDLAMADKGLGGSYTQPEDSVEEDRHPMWVVDLFGAYLQAVPIIAGDAFIASAFVRNGLMPCSPHEPSVVVTVRVLEVFRALQLRCPRLGIQAFVRGICDLHGVAPRPYLGQQFSVAYDVYLSIRAEVDKRVRAALERDAPNWRLKNACPACMYKLEGEAPLTLPLITTQDGNNSMKRFLRREREEVLPGITAAPGASKERKDNCVAPGDFFLPREDVNEWGDEGMDVLMRGFEEGAEQDEGAGCDERWENMKEDVTARAYGMYDETGIFPALCRHGFMLVIVDMVKSGELAKYGLAVINHLIRVLGEVAVGVDIGCKTGKMVKAHPRLSQLAFDNKFRCLVGSFHGLGHGRLCQVSNLATYVEGMGLEDCEGCESWFSKSNALASTTRYSTVFHRHQAIATYIQHADTCDAYQGLSTQSRSFSSARLLTDFSQRSSSATSTVGLSRSRPACLHYKTPCGVSTSNRATSLRRGLQRRSGYLRSLSKEPAEETLEMEYYQKLVNWQEHERCVREMRDLAAPFLPAPADASYAEAAKETRRVETKRRHAFEVAAKSLGAVQELELKLGIATRWEPGSEAWVKAAKMVSSRRYQRALDQLQGLVVARMFELSKVNMSGTGYKLRKHIAKALQARSKAVRTALERYNAAASVMTPPKRLLAWDEGEFDLLREGREDIRTEPWALPAGRAAMDQHFKILRADEEIARLNVEIPRLVTFMADEEDFLVHHEARLQQEGFDGLALQVARHRMERARFNGVHLDRLERRVPPRNVPGLADAADERARRSAPSTGGDNDEDGEGDGDVEAIADAFENIVRIVHDVGATEETG
ncbi:hypothetical protein B0H14DRAFT_2571643 [Mycena olivaceomarginata]|nr:hypothetical protein B0H14DRAFT_2571643 [Mycena olivaceomarginata]